MRNAWLKPTVPSNGPFQRWRQFSSNDRWLVLEAVLTLSAAAIAIRLMPFRWGATLAASQPNSEPPDEASRSTLISRSRWAIEAAAKRVPWRTVCFQKGLALHILLRRRGVQTKLHYGVGKSAKGALSAHVWITDRGEPIIGGEVLKDYACLATFPAE